MELCFSVFVQLDSHVSMCISVASLCFGHKCLIWDQSRGTAGHIPVLSA